MQLINRIRQTTPLLCRTKRIFVILNGLLLYSFFLLSPAETRGQTKEESRELIVTITSDQGGLLPARAWIDTDSGHLFQPTIPESCTPYPRDRSFSCNGKFQIEVPRGSILIHVEKGKEWMPVNLKVEDDGAARIEKTITLKRWINMPALGYYSSDLHMHFGHDRPEVLKQLSLADDLHLLPSFTYWLRGNEPEWKSSWPQWEGGGTIHVDDQHFVTRSNLEIERISNREEPGGSVGASFLFNLKAPVSTSRYDTRFPTDTTLCLNALKHSPECVIDTDKPSWGETVIGAALGVYDVAQVCHNHYHRERTLPGGWGMIGPLTKGEGDISKGDELFHRTNRQYYHWLNCGIRMGVSGGSAMGVMAVPAGYNRTYAKVEGEFGPESFWRAVKKGRTMATSGPMIFLEAEGEFPGDTLSLSSNSRTTIGIKVKLRSLTPVDSVQLVLNGRVVESAPPIRNREMPNLLEFQWNLPVKRSGWIAARTLFKSPDGRLRQAHTSPIYLQLDEKPIAFKGSATYMVRWVDRLIEIAEAPGRYRSQVDKKQVLATYAKAREFYSNAVDASVKLWGDE
ncbi:MAG TPA: hypothetical protein EYQ50_07395 [Verrucomicrobiales bacterium]|nr:hypothetical protein [Verrucomicrobiales bacterium]